MKKLHPGRDVTIFRIGPTIVGGFRLTEARVRRLIRNFETFGQRGYTVPILCNHGMDGLSYGYVTGLAVRGDRVVAKIGWLRKHEQKQQLAGMMGEWSPGFDRLFVDPHQNDELGLVLLEISYCGLGHQRNLGNANAALGLQKYTRLSKKPVDRIRLSTTAQEATKMDEKIKEALATIIEQLTSLLADATGDPDVEDVVATAVEDAVADSEDDTDDTDEELAADDKKDSDEELSRRIRHLEDELTTTQLANRGITDPATVKQLCSLQRRDKSLFASTVKHLSTQVQTVRGKGAVESVAQGVPDSATLTRQFLSASKADPSITVTGWLGVNAPAAFKQNPGIVTEIALARRKAEGGQK